MLQITPKEQFGGQTGIKPPTHPQKGQFGGQVGLRV